MSLYMHEAHLANIVTSYCTCLAGIMPMIFCLITGVQPWRWFSAYACIFLTGIPTVWMHALEMQEGLALAAFFDTGSNVLLAWALLIAVTGDYMGQRNRMRLLGAVTAFNLLAWGWMFHEISVGRKPVLRFGEYGLFYAGEVALIINAFIVTAILIRYHRRIPATAKPFLWIVLAMFLGGLLLATAKNSHISLYIIPWHASWHILGAFAFMTFFIFNHIRFTEVPECELKEMRLKEQRADTSEKQPADRQVLTA